MATISKSIGTAGTVSTGTVSLDGTKLIVTLSGGTFPASVGIGDEIIIDVDGTPETGLVLSRDSSTQLTLQVAMATQHSAEDFTLDRAYSTLQAWEDDNDNDLVTAEEIQKGFARNDSVFTARVRFTAGSGFFSASFFMFLTVIESERHDGTWGNGARSEVSANTCVSISQHANFVRVEWLSCKNFSGAQGTVQAEGFAVTGVLLRNMLMWQNGGGSGGRALNFFANSGVKVLNCFIQNENDITVNGSSNTTLAEIINCTVRGNSGFATISKIKATNVIAFNGSADFSDLVSGSDFLISEDATGDDFGSNNKINQDPTTDLKLVDESTGANLDMHLESGSSAIDFGTDLGTTDGVEIDIDEFDRDAGGVTWDVGAHEFVVAAAGVFQNTDEALTGGLIPMNGGMQ